MKTDVRVREPVVAWKTLSFFVALFAVLLGARLCHINILWAEEDLPMAAASQMRFGKMLYRDIWFDKPPLLAAIYLLWDVRIGWMLRVAGALYCLLACWLAYVFARDVWSRREGLWAAGLLAFYLTFDFPSAVIPLAADVLMIAPHIAAIYLSWRKQAFWSGIAAGIAMLINVKGLYVAGAATLWCAGTLSELGIGFLIPVSLMLLWLWWKQALGPYIDDVWIWGIRYAGKTFLDNPILTGLLRTLAWIGFHATLAIGALLIWHRRSRMSAFHWRIFGWAALSGCAVLLGWRFFPRYYFQLLPVFLLAGARAMVALGRCRWLLLALLLIPLIRFGPRYEMLARDLIAGRQTGWTDLAMDQDSREAARVVRERAKPGDTLFVWGFRPELWVYTGLPAATRFLDCQALTGVPADRHLAQSQPAVAADFTRANRLELAHSRPTFIMDGLSAYNPKLAMSVYPELRPWLAHYGEVARTRMIVVYRLLPEPAGGPLLEKR